MKKGLLVFPAIILCISAAVFAASHNGPEVITIDRIQEKKPPVKFQHRQHQEWAGGNCAVCHHATKEGERPDGCFACHGKAEGAPGFKEAMHKGCRGCHQRESAKGREAPTNCSGCHKKP